MFSKIVGFLTGKNKVVDDVFDKEKGLLTQVGQWVGHQQFTDQEQAEHSRGMNEAIQSYAIATMSENTDRSKTRRTIAVEWFKMQVWLIKLNVLCIFVDEFCSQLDVTIDLTSAVATVAFSGLLWGVTSGIGVFFWGSHTLRSSKFAKDDK